MTDVTVVVANVVTATMEVKAVRVAVVAAAVVERRRTPIVAVASSAEER